MLDKAFAKNFYEGFQVEDRDSYIYGQRATVIQHVFELACFCECGSVLDVGCNVGLITEKMADEVHGFVVGVDFSRESVRKAKQHFRNVENLNFAVMDAENLAFRKRMFDLVVSLEVIEHLLNPVDGLKEMRRVARDRVIVTTPNPWNWNLIAKLILRKIWSGALVDQVYEDYLNPLKLKYCVQACGMKTVETFGANYGFIGRFFKSPRLQKLFDWFSSLLERKALFRHFGTFQIMLACPTQSEGYGT